MFLDWYKHLYLYIGIWPPYKWFLSLILKIFISLNTWIFYIWHTYVVVILLYICMVLDIDLRYSNYISGTLPSSHINRRRGYIFSQTFQVSYHQVTSIRKWLYTFLSISSTLSLGHINRQMGYILVQTFQVSCCWVTSIGEGPIYLPSHFRYLTTKSH